MTTRRGDLAEAIRQVEVIKEEVQLVEAIEKPLKELGWSVSEEKGGLDQIGGTDGQPSRFYELRLPLMRLREATQSKRKARRSKK